MNDYVIRVDKNPIRCRKPLDSNVFSKSLFYLVAKLNGHRRDLAGRAPGSDDHIIGDVRFTRERDGDDFDRLIIVK